MEIRSGIALVSMVAACGWPVGTAYGQIASNDYVAHEQDNTDGPNFDGARPTAPAVGVSNLGVLAAGTRYLSLFSKAHTITPLDERGVDDMTFPFVLAASSGTRLLDARAYHDPIHNRLWGVYGEAELETSSPQFGVKHCEETAWLHLSVNRSGADFTVSDPLDDTEWWYYTGSGGSAGNGGEAFDLLEDNHLFYKNNGSHDEIEFTARMPSLGFHRTDEKDDRSGAIIVATNARDNCDGHFTEGGNGPPLYKAMLQFFYIIPYEHDGGAKSILDGDKPGPADITVVRPFEITPFPLVSDDSIYGHVVSAPFEQVENATFVISTPNPVSTSSPYQHIRLKGLFYNDAAPSGQEWTLQQDVTPGASPILDDIDIDASLEYTHTNDTGPFPGVLTLPKTPDLTNWGPEAQGTYFHSSVLAKDTNGDFRIFAVHAVRETTSFRWVVQWYVIDPDLTGFHSTTHGVWEPKIAEYTVKSKKDPVKASGRLEDQGHSYHPVIVVNRQGQAFIEYTYSDDSTWPSVRRVRLTNTYDAVVGSPSPVRAGPPQRYNPYVFAAVPSWANTADAQADPFNKCAYWSTHTLVNDLVDNVPDPSTEIRDAWLFHQAYGTSVGPNCLQTTSMLDLNDDDEVDTYDMVAFTDLYAKGARRVDLSGDGVVDETDMALYTAAYDAFTSK